MSNLSVFNFESQEIRFVGTADSPWWVAVDICKVLAIINVSDAVDKLDDDEKLLSPLTISGQKRDVLCVNESGLYSLVLTSRKPQAKRFKKWLTSEVIPAIRKTGAYSTGAIALTPQQQLPPIDTSKIDALTTREDRLHEDLKALEIRISATRNELQTIRREKAMEAKAFDDKYPGVVQHALKCSEILAAYGDGNKYAISSLKR